MVTEALCAFLQHLVSSIRCTGCRLSVEDTAIAHTMLFALLLWLLWLIQSRLKLGRQQLGLLFTEPIFVLCEPYALLQTNFGRIEDTICNVRVVIEFVLPNVGQGTDVAIRCKRVGKLFGGEAGALENFVVVVIGKFCKDRLPVLDLFFNFRFNLLLNVKVFFRNVDRFAFLWWTATLLGHHEVLVERILPICFRKGTTNSIHKTLFVSSVQSVNVDDFLWSQLGRIWGLKLRRDVLACSLICFASLAGSCW